MIARANKIHISQAFSSSVVFLVFSFYVVFVFVTGGGARDDISSLIVLRPASVIVAFYAALALRSGKLGSLTPIYICLSATLILILYQLIPLPPEVWKNLPGRDLYVEVAQVTSTDDIWRPLTLAPSKTLNALFSLVVPICVLLLVTALDRKFRDDVLLVVFSLALFSSIIGFLQLVSSPGGALYFYRVTNASDAVGLFANRNHHAIFLASMLPVAVHFLYAKGREGFLTSKPKSLMRYSAYVGATVTLLFGIMATGSRAGLLCGAVMVLWSSFMIWAAQRSSISPRTRGLKMARLRKGRLFLPLVLAMLGGGLAILFRRGSSFDRLMGKESAGEIRLEILPTLFEMAVNFFPFGSGFGSFYRVYYQFESDAALREAYLNQAHNEPMQILIEGGAPALLGLTLLILFFMWTSAREIYRAFVARVNTAALAAIGMLFVFLLASLVDYPLRVPSLMLTTVIGWTTYLHADRSEHTARDGSGC